MVKAQYNPNTLTASYGPLIKKAKTVSPIIANTGYVWKILSSGHIAWVRCIPTLGSIGKLIETGGNYIFTHNSDLGFGTHRFSINGINEKLLNPTYMRHESVIADETGIYFAVRNDGIAEKLDFNGDTIWAVPSAHHFITTYDLCFNPSKTRIIVVGTYSTLATGRCWIWEIDAADGTVYKNQQLAPVTAYADICTAIAYNNGFYWVAARQNNPNNRMSLIKVDPVSLLPITDWHFLYCRQPYRLLADGSGLIMTGVGYWGADGKVYTVWKISGEAGSAFVDVHWNYHTGSSTKGAIFWEGKLWVTGGRNNNNYTKEYRSVWVLTGSKLDKAIDTTRNSTDIAIDIGSYLNWQIGEVYIIGNEVVHLGSTYSCIQGHTASDANKPPYINYWIPIPNPIAAYIIGWEIA